MPDAAARGSNQYITRGGSRPDLGRRDHGPVVNQVHVEDDDIEQIGWLFHPDGERWTWHGFRTAAEARPWIDAGFDPWDAQSWRRDTRLDAAAASAWVTRFGNHPGIAAAWIQAGITDPILAGGWEAEGYNPRGAAVMQDRGYRPETVGWGWKNYGWGDHFGASWANVGFDPETADRYHRRGFGLEEYAIAREWRDADGDIPVDVAAEWHQAGMTVYGYERWGTVGVNDPTVAAEWEDRFADASIAPHVLYDEWHNAGYTLEMTEFWVEEGVTRPDQVPFDERPAGKR